MIKIDENYLQKIEDHKNIYNFFGKWIENPSILKEKFINNKPFEHIIIPNFLNENVINNIEENFPNHNEIEWYKYNNPLEVKNAFDKINELPQSIRNIFYILSTPNVISKIEELTGINYLEYDPYLHGAGIHTHPKGGKLAMHLDYEKHPILINKERRLNIILYLSKEWNPMWNGCTELWNKEMTKCVTKSNVIFNSALIFKTNELSWHGLPEEIKCPENVFRKSLAYYYVSPLISKPNKNKKGSQEDGYRKKASYALRPQDDKNEKILKLIQIRNKRRLNSDDLI